MKTQRPEKEDLITYLEGTCSPEHRNWVEEWLIISPETANELLALTSDKHSTIEKNSKSAVLDRILTHIDKISIKERADKQIHRKTILTSYKLIGFRVAAALLLSFTIGTLYFSYFHDNDRVTGAVLREVSSPSMSITSITLSDSTIVLLNANSTLTFPEKFSGTERTVYLSGEAFFEVSHEPARPFKVISGDLTTIVLGTKFNVQYRYPFKKTEIALQEGKIRVMQKGDTVSSLSNEVILSPDEWVSYSEETMEFKIHKGLGNKLLWKESILEFEGLTLIEVVSILEAWYGISVRITDSDAIDCTVVGTFENESLEYVLKGLQFVIGIDYEILEDSVQLSGGSCM